MDGAGGIVHRWHGITRRRLLCRSVGAIAGIGLLSPKESVAAAPPRRGGTLVYAADAQATTLDPPYLGDIASNTVTGMIYNNLVKFNADLEIEPDLATGWRVDGTTWIVKLRRGVTFHDGTGFDAAAVAAHFSRLLGPERPLRASQWTPFLDRVEALDSTTVRFSTKFVDPFFLERLANSTGAIESPAAVAKYGKDVARHPAGTGPFKFQEWVQDDHIALLRNDSYWGDKPYLDGVVIRPLLDSTARVLALISGEAQLARDIPPEQVARVAGDPRSAVLLTDVLGTWFFGMNVLKKPFADLRVRQALNYAIDKESIVKNIFQGMGEVSNQVVARGAESFASVPGFPYDPTKAKQLLAQAGYPNGFSATMLVTNGVYPKELEIEQFAQEQWAEVGVRITLQPAEYARYLELFRMPPTSSPLEMWIDAEGNIEASQTIIERFGCRSFRPDGANSAGFCDEEIDGLTSQAQRTLDRGARDRLLEQAQELISQQAPAVWLVQLKQAAGMSKKLHSPIFKKTGVLTVDEHTWLEP